MLLNSQDNLRLLSKRSLSIEAYCLVPFIGSEQFIVRADVKASVGDDVAKTSSFWHSVVRSRLRLGSEIPE